MRTFGRAVSLLDFADLVRASGEVAKAQAIWVWDGLDRAIHLTVAGQAGGIFADADLRRIGAVARRARATRLPAAARQLHAASRSCSARPIDVDRRYVAADVARRRARGACSPRCPSTRSRSATPST